MKWTESQALTREVLKALKSEERYGSARPPESPFHLTELIYCLTKSYMNRFGPASGKPEAFMPTDQSVMLWLLGEKLEDILLESHKTSLHGMTDGISWESDVVLTDSGVTGEMKTTRKSTKNFPFRNGQLDVSTGWIKQLLGYMYTNALTKMAYIVWFLMGNYSPPFPELKVYEVEATWAEISENWQWVLWRKQQYEMWIERAELPTPFQYNLDAPDGGGASWECDYCQYRLICDAKTAAV